MGKASSSISSDSYITAFNSAFGPPVALRPHRVVHKINHAGPKARSVSAHTNSYIGKERSVPQLVPINASQNVVTLTR